MFDPPKFTQIWIFGLKACHLATLFKIQLQTELGTGAKNVNRNGKNPFIIYLFQLMEKALEVKETFSEGFPKKCEDLLFHTLASPMGSYMKRQIAVSRDIDQMRTNLVSVSHGITRHRMASHGIARHCTTLHDIAQHRTTSHDISRHRTTRRDT
jgi:hypothetical protein